MRFRPAARRIGVLAVLTCSLLLLSCGGGGGGGGGSTDPTLTQISITPSNQTIAMGATLQLSATGYFSNGTQEGLSGVAWQSGQTSIATIDAQGKVTGMGDGVAQVSASYQGLTGNTSVTVGSASPTLVSIAVTPNQISLPVGQTEQFTATGNYSDGSKQTLTQTATWSSNGSVASVSAAGVALAQAVGTATISATSGSVTGTASLTVTGLGVVALTVTPATLSLPLGGGSQLQAVATMSDGTQQTLSSSVTWQTSQSGVATVNAQGYVTAVGKGTAQVSAVYQGMTGSAAITVGPPTLVSIAVSPNQVSLPVGQTEQFTATGTFTDGSTQNLTQSATWISSQPSIANVSTTGAALARVAGTATISATSGSVSGTANLTVTPAVAVSVNVVPAALTLPLGSSSQLQAIATMSDGTQQTLNSSVTWQTSQSAVATVNVQGYVTAVGKGTTQVSAAYQGLAGAAAITVGPAVLVNLAVSPNQVSLPIGETEQFTATGTFSDGTTQDLTQSVTWISSAPTTAAISVTGAAVAKAVGSVTISASSGPLAGTASLVVTPAVAVAVNVVPATLSLPLGSSGPLQAIATMSDGSQQTLSSSVTWQTSQSSLATVNAQGVVTAVGKGTAQVSAIYQGLTGNSSITIGAAALLSIAVIPNQVSLPLGQTEQFTATGTFTDGSTQNLTQSATWISSAPATAPVSVGGAAIAKVIGAATISATSGTVTGTANLTVVAAVPVSVNIIPSSLSLPLGSGSQLQAIITLSDGTTQDVTTTVTWSSPQPAIATVNAQGFVTATGKGTGQVSAAYQALSSNSSITVGPPVLVSVAVTPNQVSLPIGETEQFTATGTFTDGSTQNLTQTATWISSAPANASVSVAGAAVAKVLGTATISATSGIVTGTASLTVIPATAVSVNVVPTTLSMPLGTSSQLQATATMSDGTQQALSSSSPSITWQSSQPSMATVSAQGLVTAVGKGAAQVSATYEGVSGNTSVTVGPPALVSIAVTPSPSSLPIGETEQLTATGTYTDGSTQNLTQSVTWISSTPAAATVSAAGSALAKAIGTTTISATSASITGTVSLTVTPAVALSVNVAPATLTLPLGSTSQLQATANMSDGSVQTLNSSATWQTSQSTVAAVSAQGLVTAAGQGSTQVSATYQGLTGSSSITVGPAALVSITVTPTPSSLPIGETEQLTATGTFTDGTTQNLTQTATWNSSVPATASVSATGSALAKAIGTATISATSGSVTGNASLTVTPAVALSLNVVPAALSLPLGSTSQLQAIASMSDGTQQTLSSSVTWQTSQSAMAAVNAQGVVTAAGQGAAQVSATYQGLTNSASITVVPPVLVSIAVTPASPSLPVGETQQFKATGTFTDGTTQDLTLSATWTSSTATIASISPAGLASGLVVGSTTVTAVSGTIQGSTTLAVVPPVVTSIAVAPANASITVINTQQFTATGTYSDGSTQDLTGTTTWSSVTPGVATITSAGLATGVAPGTTTISATTGGITGSTTLTVLAPVLVSIAVNPGNPSIAVGGTQQFTATGTYNNGTTQDLTSTATWSSSLPAVATIGSTPSQNLATAVGVGTTTISATSSATSGSISGSTTLTVTAGFVLTGSAKNARQYHTATLLNNGLVLIAGGYGSTSTLASAELYNPATGTFTPTGSMSTARSQHTATLLPNGMVLIAGGIGVSGNVASAEIYNPATGKFTSTGSLNTARAMHTATLLSTGMVLVAGGVDSSNSALDSAEIYNPAAATFTTDASILNVARALHTATTLNNGLVLLAGGNPGSAQTSAELYDPVADTFTLTGTLNAGRYDHTATLLNNGMVLLAGGFGSGGLLDSAELYDPNAGIFFYTGSLNTARFEHTATLLNNGTVLIAGGFDTSNPQSSAELYDPVAAAFAYTGSLNTARYNHTATLLSNGMVLIAGGQGSKTYLSSAELYEPGTLTPPNLVSIALGPNNPTIPLDDAQQMIATGTFGDGTTQQLASATWSSSDTTSFVTTNDVTDSGQAYALGGAGTATVTACTGSICGSTTVVVGPPALALIAVTPATATIAAGGSIAFDAMGTYTDGSTQDITTSVTWISSDWDVASITTDGQVSGWTGGAVTISANSGSVTGNANLTVNSAVASGLSIKPASLSIAPGGSLQLQVIETFSDGSTQDVTTSTTWSYQVTGIVFVNQTTGVITGQKVGSTTVIAHNRGFTASASVTVAAVTAVNIIPITLDMVPGTSSQFQAIATLTGGATEDITTLVAWSSTQPGLASVSSGGLVTAVQVGAPTIQALINGITGSATVNVVSPATLSIVPSPLSMSLGSSRQLRAIATFNDGTTEDVTATAVWSSTQPTIVSVNSGGGVTGQTMGSTTVLAQNDGLTASVNITVMPLVTVQYFNLANAQASGIDSTVQLVNPGLTTGTLCAMVYVFDQNQELNECCGCSISDEGVRTLSLVNDLTANPLTGQPPPAGTIEIVASDPTLNPQCNAGSLAPLGQINAWGTHIQNAGNGTYQITESDFATSALSSAKAAYLSGLCSYMQQLGSGSGVCGCGTGGN
jgi:uncharacterized protein YjdB